MSMRQDTLQRYVDAYRHPLPGQVPPTQEEALQCLTRLSYWIYARYDREIHFVQLPGCILEQDT